MIASGFVQNGARVYLFSRKPDYAISEALTKKGPGECFAFGCDVGERVEIDAVVETISKREKHIDVLVNNAGATWGASFDSTPSKSFDKLHAVNVRGLFEASQAFMPLLEAAASPSKPGSIINIGSIDGIGVPGIEEYAYAASKAAVIHLTKVMAGNLAPRNVTVNCICPGLFPSKMGNQVLDTVGEAARSGIPMKREGKPSDIASAALFLSGFGGAYTTGATLTIDGGLCVKPRM
jgi:NAD(P)-dependent dehydrogenase (short-subunit alcohol dehydrogenase family)